VIALVNLNPAEPLPILNRPVDPRLTLYHNSLYLGRDYAFTGIGLGSTFGNVYSRHSLLIQPLFLTYSSNLLLSVWLNQGLLGLVAFVGIVVTYYGYIAPIIRQGRPRALFHGLWLGVTASLVHGLFDARQYTESAWTMPVLFIALGLTIAYGQLTPAEESDVVSFRQWVRWPLSVAGAALVLLVVGFVSFRATITAAWQTNQGALAETRGEFAPDLSDDERAAQLDSALGGFQAALDTDPDYAPANRRLGNLLVGRESFNEAVPLLERAYAHEPTNPAAIKGLGLAYVWVGRTEEAAQVLQELPDVTDMTIELYTWGYYRSGDEQQQPLLAAYAWETAETMGGAGNIDVWMQIAAFYEQADAPERARAAYEHVIELDPNNEAAQAALAALGESSQ
jgi:tetratricopeptide (TPR) repeat protein